ncbi:MAG TPA: cytochrome b/b6 domain-containing protein [Gallionellaceae bacterium]|nr:cytochrome b/b6 domain-containing protein [Gallionellaceae bacterium]
MTKPGPLIHPLWLRITHWLNVLAVLLMVLSGWRIYNASPLFDFRFPDQLTLGGWLAGALLWHFAAMWLLGVNGLLYLALNLFSGRFRRQFLPLRWRDLRDDLLSALRLRLHHADLRVYNAPQKLAYLFMVLDIAVLVASGLVLWKSVQFPLLRELMGGYEGARIVHFVAMAALLAVLLVHLVMVALLPRTLLLMLRGR